MYTLIFILLLLCPEYLACQINPKCIWSFNTNTLHVYKNPSHRSLFEAQFPIKHLVHANSIYFFDSSGSFKKSIMIKENKILRTTHSKQLIFIRADVPVYSEIARCSVQVISENGHVLCNSYFNIMHFSNLIGIGEGRSYIRGPNSFLRVAFFDSNLLYIPIDYRYYALHCFVHESNNIVFFLSSPIGGPLDAITESFLVCATYRGDILWKAAFGQVDTKSFKIQANSDNVVVCFDDGSESTKLLIYAIHGEEVYSAILPSRVHAISNILNDELIILRSENNELIAQLFSIKTNTSKEYLLSYGGSNAPLSNYSAEFYNNNSLLISENVHDVWHYAYYLNINELLHHANIRNDKRPIVFVHNDDLIFLKSEEKRLSLLLF